MTPVKSLEAHLQAHPDIFFSGRRLCVLLGFPLSNDRRALRLAIQGLVESGCPIIASEFGYAWCKSPGLARNYESILASKIDGLQYRLKLVRRIRKGGLKA